MESDTSGNVVFKCPEWQVSSLVSYMDDDISWSSVTVQVTSFDIDSTARFGVLVV